MNTITNGYSNIGNLTSDTETDGR